MGLLACGASFYFVLLLVLIFKFFMPELSIYKKSGFVFCVTLFRYYRGLVSPNVRHRGFFFWGPRRGPSLMNRGNPGMCKGAKCQSQIIEKVPGNWRTNKGFIDLNYHLHAIDIIRLTFPLFSWSHQQVRVVKQQTINWHPGLEFFYAMIFLRKFISLNKPLLKNIGCSIGDTSIQPPSQFKYLKS